MISVSGVNSVFLGATEANSFKSFLHQRNILLGSQYLSQRKTTTTISILSSLSKNNVGFLFCFFCILASFWDVTGYWQKLVFFCLLDFYAKGTQCPSVHRAITYHYGLEENPLLWSTRTHNQSWQTMKVQKKRKYPVRGSSLPIERDKRKGQNSQITSC